MHERTWCPSCFLFFYSTLMQICHDCEFRIGKQIFLTAHECRISSLCKEWPQYNTQLLPVFWHKGEMHTTETSVTALRLN